MVDLPSNEKEDIKGTDSDAEVNAPVVFQCDHCRTVLGDSYSFVTSDTDMHTLTLEGAINVVKSRDASTSKEGRDAGSTYNILTCQQCKSLVGKVYLTTARHLDEIRDMFTFDTEAISSYQLGTNVYASKAPTENTVHSMDAGVTQMIEEFRRDMTKVQNIILVLDERIQNIEAKKLNRKELSTADASKKRRTRKENS